MSTPHVDLSQYGIPSDAARRIAENADGAAGAVFTSDLSVNEFLLVRQAGFRPLGLVLGSSVYHIGAPSSPRSTRAWSWACSPRRCTTPGSWR